MPSASEASSDDAHRRSARSRDRAAKRSAPSISTAPAARATTCWSRPARRGCGFFRPAGDLLDEWLYAELRRQAAPDGVLRLGRHGETLLARLEVRDAALAAAIEDRAVTLDRGGVAERKLRRKVVILSLAAVVSLILTAIVGVPVLATRLTPLIPVAVEQKLGNAVDSQIRATLDTKHLGAGFVCGTGRKRRRGTGRARQAGRAARRRRRPCHIRCGWTWCGARISTPSHCPAATSTCSRG